MAEKRKTVNLLPEYFRSDKNKKFLSSTIDQLIQEPELERINGFIGTRSTPNFNPVTDIYISEKSSFRRNYQLEPSLVIKDSLLNIKDVIGYDDLLNEIKNQGGNISNHNKLFKNEFSSYYPLIDWDKLINYSFYYWLPSGPESVLINNLNSDLLPSILGNLNYTTSYGYNLTNGMKLVFSKNESFNNFSVVVGKEYIVEGVGSSIVLVEFDKLEINQNLSESFNERFDSDAFDILPFDGDKKLPSVPEYVTINKSSKDLNPWTRYNRWFHEDVIKITALINGKSPAYPVENKARRPIIEFKANIQLYNFGNLGIRNVDLLDNDTVDPFSQVQGTNGYYIDGVLLEQGQTVIFNVAKDEDVRGKVYKINFTTDPVPVINLEEIVNPDNNNSISVDLGNNFSGTNWYFDSLSTKWIFAQQHLVLNDPPIFDLYNIDGISYTSQEIVNNFTGTKIFGYDIGDGSNDDVLGFPLKYENSSGVGSYLFKNYFTTETVNFTVDGVSFESPVSIGYLKINDELKNVWVPAEDYQIPIVENQVVESNTSTLIVKSFDKPFNTTTSVVAYINGIKVNSSITFDQNVNVTFTNELKENDAVQLNLFSEQVPNANGYYEPSLNLTNNPLNGPIGTFTLSELADHVSSMIPKINNFEGTFPGKNNLRDIDDYSKYGTRLIINSISLAFPKLFLAKKDHNLIDAIRSAGFLYNQFKFNLINFIPKIDAQIIPSDALDIALKFINQNKNSDSLFYRSDMVPYGEDKIVDEYTVGVVVNTSYPVRNNFVNSKLSFNSLLVYVNNNLLTIGYDYIIDEIESAVTILSNLTTGDKIKICFYNDTKGSFIPPTPSKLGLYPKFKPEIVTDNSYTSGPVLMIRGHDGSLTKAFGDYRDQIILEFEKRVYNNIKVNYNSKIFDMLSVIPGAFRNSKFTIKDSNNILRKDFIRWAGQFNVDYSSNTTFDEGNPFTYNFKSTVDNLFLNSVSGTWRGIYKYFYDTDRPHTHPWEMLGHLTKPSWWDTYYSWTDSSKRESLITALVNGFTEEPPYTSINLNYSRPGVSDFIPVDINGNLLSPDEFLVSESSLIDKQQSWEFGDFGPAEVAWRRSSLWPFSVNIVAALLDPCSYTSKLFDVSRIALNDSDQIIYNNDIYISPSKLIIDDQDNQSAGFGNWILENGKLKNLNYIDILKNDLTYIDFNLFHKLGGFTSKNKIQLIMDTVDPVSISQGAILPPESYSLILNTSNTIESFRISGIIIQKYNGKFLIKGYDATNPYFEILSPIVSNNSKTITVGGISETFTDWTSISSSGNLGITFTDISTAAVNTTRYYKQGQLVRYNNRYYRVKIGHSAGETFDESLFQLLSVLPVKGGVTVQVPVYFESISKQIPYGTSYSTIQEVYNFILGYGEWLTSRGFIFDEYDNDLFEVLDWKFSAKEFLYWTTQNWGNNNLITISPFAKSLKFGYQDSIVDNINAGSYEYSLLKADGKTFPKENIKLSRDDGICKIETLNTEEGLFFAVLNIIQKEHAMVFDNNTLFNDVIYDIETGYRQRRLKISGFRTSNWNGDFFSPGFVYDEVSILDWKPFVSYLPGTVVRYNSVYYESLTKIVGAESFNFNEWIKLPEKPIPELLPNFSYKINQFEDFYSLDIDNFDIDQQKLAQHLIGYTERPYLSNIFTNPTTQYKFYQGYIREKGTRNAIDKISKVGVYARKGSIDFNEEWAFRIGHYGSFETLKEIEFTLNEGDSLENPYIVKFSDDISSQKNNLINYTSSTNVLIKSNNFDINNIFEVNTENVYGEDLLKLISAGYVRPDDVTVTAYNKNSLLDIANNNLLQEKNTVWLGFLENGSWTVYRYSRKSAKISGVFVSSPGIDITFVCDVFHGLSVGDIVSVVNFNEQVNGIYIVKSIPKLNQFTVDSTLASIVDEDLVDLGLLFAFDPVRFNNFYDLSNYKDLFRFENNEKVWIDNADQKWAVYEKIKNYNTGISFNSYTFPFGQELGHTIYSKDDSITVLISSPAWNNPTFNSRGRIWVYKNRADGLEKQFEYILNSGNKIYCSTSTNTEFGYSLNYDDDKKLIFAGAPGASNIILSTSGTISYSTGTGSSKGFTSEGLVKISRQKEAVEEEETVAVLLAPYSYSNTSGEANYLRFGNSIYLNKVSDTTSTTVLIGAPGDGTNNNSTGYVFAYYLNTTTTGIEFVPHPNGITLSPSTTLTSYDRWGEKISGSSDGKFIAISAPGYTSATKTGLVEIFDNELSWKQTLYSPFDENQLFGTDIFVSPSGKFLFISSTDVKNSDGSSGKLAIYTATNLTSTGTYVLRQVIENPAATLDLKFGYSISINKNEDILVVGSLGKNRSSNYVFDETTSFDNNTTKFIAPIDDAGTAYVFNNLGDYFVQAEELSDAAIIEGSRFGFAVAATNNYILVGAPWLKTASTTDDSTFFKFDKIDTSVNSWKLLRAQPNIVESEKIRSIKLIDTFKEEIIDYLDVFDPLKGKLPGVAEQELKYKSTFDPALYSIGTALTSVDTDSSWIDEHIGELWWDLSTVKYIWYEQGDEIFRKNNWGKLFPGSSIDVYEWVKSDLLPSEWAEQADTNDGLTKGISGQPKYPDNSVMSVKQVFNNVTNSFENVYYFWVKNKVTLPNSKNRRISGIQVANLILDPAANGLRFAEVLSQNSIAFANIQPILIGDRINANISFDEINNDIPRHTEWLLLEEGNKNSVPPVSLTRKLFDSLLGHDNLGNIVPDLALSYRNRYGIEFRPKQSMFKNRLEALRNLVEFSNYVLEKNKITGFYSFENLNKKEEIPDQLSRDYDVIVEDLTELDLIETSKFIRAELSCTTFNGKIVSVQIVNPGFGYSLPPKVTIYSSTGVDAEILTLIDNTGRVVGVEIIDQGQNYVEDYPVIEVRPHTVIVQVNSDYNNRWTKHVFNYEYRTWTRIKTQSYNTPLYWSYIDWVDSGYNGYKDFAFVLNDASELPTAASSVKGDYVKINNIGDNRYVILERLGDDEIGDFALNYKIVYSQNGTIKILDSIWNYAESNFAYDVATLEETLYDQIPDQELNYILYALKDDIFVKDLKVNWNLFFFKAVRYALSEQKLLDWAFKTSFISVSNQIGELDQRSTYRLDNESYFEDYIKEIKPYRTKIRSYTSKYTSSDEIANTSITDFDLPAYFSTVSNSYELVGLNDPEITSYPWKWWYDNYKYYVKSILVSDNGEGYTQNPTVVITSAPGDTGSGATAEAYIRNGGVFKILISNPGSGYILPPQVQLVGGGSNIVRPAKISVELSNDYVRKNTLSLKFDRIGSREEFSYEPVVETFNCSGITNRFRLTWLADPNKSNITPLLDGKIVLSTDYTVEYFTENINNYTRRYCEFVFLNYVPKKDQQFNITYHKNIGIFQAVDRINNFYEPTEDMVGKEIPLLMTGAEYQNTILQGLSFSYSPPWNQGYYDNDSVWADLVDYYASAKLIQTATYKTTTLFLNSVSGIQENQKILLTNTSTGYLRTDTIVTSVNSLTNSITINNREYKIKRIIADSTSTQGNIVFFTDKKFNNDIPLGALVEISGVDGGTVTGFDGQYIVTNSGSDRFTAIGTGTHYSSVLSTSSVKIIGTTAKVEVPSLFNTLDVLNVYKVLDFTDYITNTSTIFYDTKILIPDVSGVKIYLNGSTTPLGTSVVPAEYYNATASSSGTFAVEIYNLGVVSNNAINVKVYGYPKLEFWKDNFSLSGLDTELEAGSWDSSGNFVGALGVNPEEFVVNGSGLVNQKVGNSPEEHVKGSMFESVGISVFTQEINTSPIAMAGVVPIVKNQVCSTKIGIPLEEAVSILVNFKGKSFDRLYNVSVPEDISSIGSIFTSPNQFFVYKDTLYIAPQSVDGRAGYNLLTISGEYVADSATVLTGQNQTTATLISSAKFDDVKSAYVTIDGEEVPLLTSPSGFGYQIVPAGAKNNRAAVTVYDISGSSRTIQAWFLKSSVSKFNGMWTEYFDVGVSTTVLNLSRLPGTTEPLSPQALVEVFEYNEGSNVEGRKRLNPPDVVYYEIKNNQTVFAIDNITRPPGTYTIANTKVYSNGQLLAPGFDFSLNSTNGTITLQSGLLPNGTMLAIETLTNFDYVINGNSLILSAAPTTSTTIKVTSFSEHDGMMLRTERFTGNSTLRFTLGLPVTDSRFVWASVNKYNLVSGYDFELLADLKTIQINNWVSITSEDEVTISYVASPFIPNVVLGYKIFQDIFNRSSYSRLSNFYSTRLTKELTLTDTEIHVEDSSNLIPPNPHRNLPGVVFIDGERIEFFSKDSNTLGDLRRSTMGTAPATFSEIGTNVLDQSLQQFIPYKDTIKKQYHVTGESTGTFIVNTVTNVNNTYTVVISSSSFIINTGTVYQTGGDGITIVNDQFKNDQIFVKFGGRPLRKNSIIVHDKEISYDSTATSLKTIPPEFVTRYNNVTGNFELDINVVDFKPGTKIEIEQKVGTFWQTSTSIIYTDSVQANFIRQKTTELPDSWYYGGTPVLTDNDDFELLDENDDPIEGY